MSKFRLPHVVGQTFRMSEQLWAIGGVVAGIVATGGMNLYTEKRKAAISANETLRGANKERCRAFLKSIEDELSAVYEYEEHHGVAPVDDGHEPRPANARGLLTDMELHCPVSIYKKAVALTESLEQHTWGNASADRYAVARKDFVQAFRKL